MPTRATTRSAAAGIETPGPSRPVRATRTPAKPKPPTAKKQQPEDELASEMDRVLKVSEPEPQPKSREPAASPSSKSKANGTATKATTVRKTPTVASKTAATRVARTASTAKTATSATTIKSEEAGPSVSSSSQSKAASSTVSSNSVNAPPRPVIKAAPSAKKAVNTSSAVRRPTATSAPTASSSRLTAAPSAVKATQPAVPAPSSKVVYATRPTVSLKGKEREMDACELNLSELPWLDTSSNLSSPDRAQQAMASLKVSVATLASAMKAGYAYGSIKDEWTAERIDKEMAVCDGALRLLRQLDDQGLLGSKAIEVEKAAQAVIGKSLGLSMPRRAFTQLALTRQRLVKLCKTDHKELPSRHFVKEAPDTKRIPKEWLSPLWLPQPGGESTLSEGLRMLCLQQLIASWTALISLEGYGYDLPVFAELLPTAGRKSDEWLDPYYLALTLPPGSSLSLISFLSRRLSHIPISTPHWPRVFLVTIQAVLCTASVSASPDPYPAIPAGQVPRAPSAVWDTTRKWTLAYIGKSDTASERHATAARLLNDIICWADTVIAKRGEERQAWYTGEQWKELLNVWIDLARKSRNHDALDRAMSIMTGSMTIGSATARDSTPDASSRPLSPEEATIHMLRLFAQLGSVEALPAELDASSLPLARDTLAQTDWSVLGQGLGGLADDDAGRQSFARCFRATERARRIVSPWVQKPVQSDTDFIKTCRDWLIGLTVNIEEGLRLTTLAAEKEYDSLIGSCVASVNTLVRHQTNSTPQQQVVDLLHRGRRVAFLASTATARSESLRTLAHSAYTCAYDLNSRQSYESALAIIDLAIEICDLAISSVEDKAQLDTEPWQDLLMRRVSKLELKGTILYSIHRKEDAIATVCQSLTRHPESTLDSIAKADDTVPQATVLGRLPRLNNTIVRLAKYLCGDLEPMDPTVLEERIHTLVTTLDSSNVPANTANWMLERLLESILQRAATRDGLETAYRIGEQLLDRLDGVAQAVQATRVASHLMLLTSSYGLHQDRFDGLVSRAGESLTQLRSEDDSDSVLVAEYQAINNIVRAFQAYQVEENPTAMVLSLSTEAIEGLRGLLVPPSRSRETSAKANSSTTATARGSKATKTPSKTATTVNSSKKTARSASASAASQSTKATAGTGAQRRRSSSMPVTSFRDISRLASLLTSLISLLGLLGHVLAKVDALKVLRAMLRHREECLDDYVSHSIELASLYSRLGKYSRASTVFAQALRTNADHPTRVMLGTQVETQVRYSEHLAALGELEKAKATYAEAERLHAAIEEQVPVLYRDRIIAKCTSLSRLALAYRALATTRMAEDNASDAIRLLKTVVTLRSRCVSNMSLLATENPAATDKKAEDAESSPFIAQPPDPAKTGANEPSKDEVAARTRTSTHPFADKFLYGLQWFSAEHVMDAYIDLSNAYAQRGSAYDANYYLAYAEILSTTVRSAALSARTAVKIAALKNRLRQVEDAKNKLLEATTSLAKTEGPDSFDLQTAKGDWLARQHLAKDANEQLEAASKGIHGLDGVFTTADALLPSPRKEGAKRPSLTASARVSKEPLLPSTLSQIMRQQAWLLRQAGQVKDSDELYRQAKTLQTSSELKAADAYLVGRIALDNAFNHFKTDLFMSSLTESTIAMPMGTSGKKLDHRQSARHRIQVILDQADQAYRTALSLVAGSGKVEDVRQACLSLALLRAFQTSLGQGSLEVTSVAADLLATSTSVTLQRELLEAIEAKFTDISVEEIAWPALDGRPVRSVRQPGQADDGEAEEDDEDDPASEAGLRAYWNNVKSQYEANNHLSPDGSGYDLSVLPKNWAVVSISVTEDRNTMLISRHQNGHDPIVFCLPLDRQSNRDSDMDPFTFEMGMSELSNIVAASDKCSKEAKQMITNDQKKEWWASKRALDERMKALIENVEFCWLGAFKTIFSPKMNLAADRLAKFRIQIERVFNLALFGSAHDAKGAGKVHLNDSLLECFANLPHDSREEEIEDLVYFILDIYQFHGVPVALHELDFEQMVCDLQTPLAELQASLGSVAPSVEGPEHLLLALNKDAQAFPWESIPYLRGRPISRIPSLPTLLDQLALGKILQPGSARRTVNSRKTYFILNPSGDLLNTQEAFEPLVKDMQERSGWKGIVGEKPTELELSRILRDYDLVLYFGHGGAEQYIRGNKVRTLPKCATTFLWGCSSGKLEDQGDLDVAGTAWNYMMAGCPALTATLWDVTDRDIDRVTLAVFKRLGLDAAHVMQQEKPRAEHSKPGFLPISGQGLGISTVEAVNQSRDDCKMTYLTGAAVVHYGIPVYIY